MRFRLSLIIKLTLAISLILIGFMSLLDFVNLKFFRQVMIEYTISNTDQMAEIINQSTFDAMMKNDKTSLYQMIGRIARNHSIEHIRLIDREGKVVYSSVAKEIGILIDKRAETCAICHQAGDPRPFASSMNRSRQYRNAYGKEVLGVIKAIYNQPGCSAGACHFHNKKHHVLGILDITVSLEDLQQKSHEYRMQFIVMTCLLLLFIGTLITLMIQRLVNRPVQRMVLHTAKVAAGNLEARMRSDRTDELGDLADALDRMTASLGKAHEELREWAASLEHKVEERSLEINRMQTQLHRSEKLASLGNLVAGIAHEINNPLSGVLLYASIVNNDSRLDPALKTDLERIITETRRCAEIVKQLLEFSREAVPHRDAVSLNALLENIIKLLHHQLVFENIDVVRRFDPGLPAVFVDSNQIQQVFVNLVINACHAMPEGGSLTITTMRSLDGAYACAEIADTGCGISEENLRRIFDPFFTTKSEGTGLGLSISYGIVENNSGIIEVKSRLGEGTAFIVMLPLHSGAQAALQGTISAEPST